MKEEPKKLLPPTTTNPFFFLPSFLPSLLPAEAAKYRFWGGALPGGGGGDCRAWQLRYKVCYRETLDRWEHSFDSNVELMRITIHNYINLNIFQASPWIREN